MLSSSEILAILQRVKELGYRRFRLESAGIVLEVDTEAGSGLLAPRSAGSAETVRQATNVPASSLEPTQHADTSLVAIKAPMSGTFFRAPAPNAPPFVDVGSRVSAVDTVCIIEVMKLFNTIMAGVDGTVVEIAAKNEQPVRTGQPVIWIKPD